MSTILVTGASGFIGKAFSPAIAQKHNVICMSRQYPKLDIPFVRGAFQSFEDLRQLDQYQIDVVVHLGAVLGGCLERDGILVNVEGSRCLMRYLIDRGCKKFVMTSSVALAGGESMKFRPKQLPLPNDHPCLDRDGYGLSKYLMEEITHYYQRQNEDIDVINLRLASIVPEDKSPALVRADTPLSRWAFVTLARMYLADAIDVFTLAAEAAYKPGVRTLNATGSKAWAADPVADILHNWYGDDFDASYFEQNGHQFDSVYDVKLIEKELGFVAQRLPKK